MTVQEAILAGGSFCTGGAVFWLFFGLVGVSLKDALVEVTLVDVGLVDMDLAFVEGGFFSVVGVGDVFRGGVCVAF